MADDVIKPASSVKTLRAPADLLVTPHFRVSEFDCPARYGLPVAMYPDELINTHLRRLCEALERYRADFGGQPVKILNGYRTAEWNRRHIEAGHRAAPDSQHLQGWAADFVIKGVEAAIVQARVLALHRAGVVRIGGLGIYPSFTHVDIRLGEPAIWIG